MRLRLMMMKSHFLKRCSLSERLNILFVGPFKNGFAQIEIIWGPGVILFSSLNILMSKKVYIKVLSLLKSLLLLQCPLSILESRN